MKLVFDKDKYKVEPGNIHHIASVINFNIGNVERTLADPPCGCTADDIPDTYVTKKGKAIATYNGKNVYKYATDITGKVILMPGFNCGIIKSASGNSLQIISSRGIGASLNEKQEEFPIYEDEEANKPANSFSMAGGIKCTDTIKTINGLHMPNIMFNANSGITATVNGNTIELDVDDSMLNNCEGECGK